MVTGSVQTKKGYFYIVVNFTDECGKRKQKWIPTGLPEKGNKRAANNLLAQTLQEYQSGALTFSKEIPFTDWLEQWLSSIKESVRENTYDSYRIQVRSGIIPYFKEHPISLQKLSIKELRNYYNYKLQTCSPKTVKKHRSNIQLALEMARQEKLIPYNPNSDIKISSSKEAPFTQGYYDLATLAKLVEAAQGDPLEAVIILTSTYGLRRSEVLGLTWQSVDFSNNLLSIFRTAVVTSEGVLYQERTKNKTSRRVLPISPEISSYLLTLYNHQQRMKKVFGNSYIENDLICKRDNGEPLKPTYVSEHFQELLKSCALPRIRFHDLRHSAATALINMGFSMKEVSEWLGHSDITTTMNIYAHVLDKTKVSMAAGLSSSIMKKSSEMTSAVRTAVRTDAI